MNTLYDRLGGPNQVSRIMEDFQRRTWQDPQLRVFFQDQRHSFFKIHQWNLVKLALTVWEEEDEDNNKAESSSSSNSNDNDSSSSSSSKSTTTTTTAMDEQLAIIFARHAKLFAPLPEEENKTKQESFNNKSSKAMAVNKKGQAHPLEMMEQHTESETESDESSELSVVRQQSQTPIILGVEACDAMLLHLIHSLQANRVPQYITDRAIVTLAKVRDVFVQGNRYQPKVDLTKTAAAKPKPKMSLLLEEEDETENNESTAVEPSATAVRTSPRPRLVRSLSCDLSPQDSPSKSLQSQRRERLKPRPSLLRKSSACDVTHDDNDDNDDDDDNHIIVAAAIAESRRRRGRPNDDHLRDRDIPLTISTGNRRASLLKSQSTFFRKSVRVLTKAL